MINQLWDKFGTLLGFTVGVVLVVFGISWPEHLSNYFTYKTTGYDQSLEVVSSTDLCFIIDASTQLPAVRGYWEAVASGADNLEGTKKYDLVELKECSTVALTLNQKREMINKLKALKKDYETSLLGNFGRFGDLKSFVIVFFGAFSSVLIAFPLSRALQSFIYIFQAFSRKRETVEYLDVYYISVYLKDKILKQKPFSKNDLEHIQNKYMNKWVAKFVGSGDLESESPDSVIYTKEMIDEIINSEKDMYHTRIQKQIEVMDFFAAAAPAFGMAGTIIGLVLMLGKASGNADDITGVIGGMAVAMLTTLYGVLMANLIFTPVANKQRQSRRSSLILMEMIRDSILYMRGDESLQSVMDDLIVFLPDRVEKKLSHCHTPEELAQELGGKIPYLK